VWFFDNSFRFLNNATVSFVAFESIVWAFEIIAKQRIVRKKVMVLIGL
jgi:hypothetical protein